MKTGMELEFWVTDGNGRLELAKPIADRVYFASQEFSRSMIEIQTEPHRDTEELFQELISKTEILAELARKDGRRIVPLGTPLNSGEVNVYDSERFRIEQKVIGPEVRHAGRTAGLHIHFEKENVLNQLNTLTAMDPLTALVNSSPYYQGENTAAGSRNHFYRYRACGPFPQQRQLWKYVDSLEEWRYRRRKLFQKFLEKAEQKGITEEKVSKYFTPENAVWTPVKLREDYPTVEWRAPDTTLPTEAIKLLRKVKPVVEKGQLHETKQFKQVKEASEKAIQEGLNSTTVRDYIEDTGIETTEFNPLTQKLKQGKNITRKKAREKRLEASNMLNRDIEKARQELG